MQIWEPVANGTLRCSVACEAETSEVGLQIAHYLKLGDVVGLVGELGAGKTRFVKAVAQSLGVPLDEVSSPTFTLIQEYSGRVLIRHCDTYRLRNIDEFADLGLDELFARDGIAFVEWADRVEEYLPLDRLMIRIAIDTPDSRTIEVSATGNRSREILQSLREDRESNGNS